MKNELKRHKKSDSIKWAFIAIALLLLFVAIIGMGLQFFGAGNLKPSEWFKKSVEQSEESEAQSGEEFDGDLVISNFASASLTKGVKLSASIESPVCGV